MTGFDERKELFDDLRRVFATKEDVAQLKTEFKGDIAGMRVDMAEMRGELLENMATLRGGLQLNMANIKGELEVRIANVKSDIIRWMFAFFVTMLLAILGLYFKR